MLHNLSARRAWAHYESKRNEFGMKTENQNANAKVWTIRVLSHVMS